MTITRETLERDRQRRERDRRELARAYDRAADVLDAIRGEHRAAVRLLRDEAAMWRR